MKVFFAGATAKTALRSLDRRGVRKRLISYEDFRARRLTVQTFLDPSRRALQERKRER